MSNADCDLGSQVIDAAQAARFICNTDEGAAALQTLVDKEELRQRRLGWWSGNPVYVSGRINGAIRQATYDGAVLAERFSDLTTEQCRRLYMLLTDRIQRDEDCGDRAIRCTPRERAENERERFNIAQDLILANKVRAAEEAVAHANRT